MYGADRMTGKSGCEPGHITLLCDAARLDVNQRSSVGSGSDIKVSYIRISLQ